MRIPCTLIEPKNSAQTLTNYLYNAMIISNQHKTAIGSNTRLFVKVPKQQNVSDVPPQQRDVDCHAVHTSK